MQAYSGSHSIIWACTCTHRVWRKVAPLNVLLNKDNLIKAGITRGMISFGWSLLKFGFIWTSWQAFVCLPLELIHTHKHTVKFHTFTGWIINLELDLAPVRKSPRVQQCLNNNAAVTRQTDAARAPSRNEVSVAKTTLDEAEKFQGAERIA